MDDNTVKLLIESLNKNIEMIRREILCKIDDSNLRTSESFQNIKDRLQKIEDSTQNFVKKEYCEKKQGDEVTRQEFKLKKMNLLFGAVGAGFGVVSAYLTSLFANGYIKLP